MKDFSVIRLFLYKLRQEYESSLTRNCNINAICVNASRSSSVEMKLELEGSATERIATWEVESSSVKGMVATTSFWVQRILSGVILGSLLVIRKNLLGGGDVHKFLLRCLLLLLVGELVRMPFESQFFISFLNIFLGRTSLHPQDFVIISLSCLLLQFLSLGHAFLGSREPFILLQCSSEVVESLKGRNI